MDKTIEITGTVLEFRFISPHVLTILDVTKEDGTVERWQIDSRSSHNYLRRQGWDENTFRPGDVITVSGPPHQRDIPQMEGREYVRADGTSPGDGRSPRQTAEVYPPDPSARSLSGRWLPPDFFRGEPGAGSPMPLTPEGLEAWASYDPLTSPIVTCEPMNLPTLFHVDYLMGIRVSEEEVVIQHELYDVTRRVPFSSEPQPQEPSGWFGQAAARMEGDILVIESSGYPASRWGLAVETLGNGNGGDVPSSDGKRLIERYSVSADGRTLRLDYTVEDPVYLTEPYSYHTEWTRLGDDAPIYAFECDPDSAAQFTGLALEREIRQE